MTKTQPEDAFYFTFDKLMRNKISYNNAATRNQTKQYLKQKPIIGKKPL